MTRESAPNERKPTAKELEASLWEQKLFDPEVIENLIRRKNSLRLITGPYFLLFALVLCATVVLSTAFHWVFAIAGVLFAMVLLGKRRSELARACFEIERLVGEPSAEPNCMVIFNSVALNKIMMEACDRSDEVERYIREVNSRGRYKLTQFENDTILKILAALDRQSGEGIRRQ